jgi:hypothetical protein
MASPVPPQELKLRAASVTTARRERLRTFSTPACSIAGDYAGSQPVSRLTGFFTAEYNATAGDHFGYLE